MRVCSYFNPYINHKACTNFKKVEKCKKVLVVITTIFATLISLPLVGIGGMVVFRALVDKWKPKHKQKPKPAVEKASRLNQVLLQPKEEVAEIRIFTPKLTLREMVLRDIRNNTFDQTYSILAEMPQNEREEFIIPVVEGCIKMGLFDTALQVYHLKAETSNLKDSTVFIKIAQGFFSKQEYVKSADVVRTIFFLEKPKDYWGFYRNLAKKLLELKDPSHAYHVIWKLYDAPDFHSLSERAQEQFIEIGDYKWAYNVAFNCRDTDIFHRLYEKLGVVYLKNGEYDNAEKAFKHTNHLPQYYIKRVEIGIEQKKWEDAIRFLELLPKETPKDAYLSAIANGNLESSNISHLQKAVDCALKMESVSDKRQLLKKIFHRKMDLGLYDKFLEIDKHLDPLEGFDLYNFWIEKLFNSGDLENAHKLFVQQKTFGREAVYDPQSPPFLFRLAEAYLARNELDKARKIVEEEIVLNVDIHFLGLLAILKAKVADAYFNKGDLDTALQFYANFWTSPQTKNAYALKVAKAYLTKDIDKVEAALRYYSPDGSEHLDMIRYDCAKEYFKRGNIGSFNSALNKITDKQKRNSWTLLENLLSEGWVKNIEDFLDSNEIQNKDLLYDKLATNLITQGELQSAARVMAKYLEILNHRKPLIFV